jgi:hypothetical protein
VLRPRARHRAASGETSGPSPLTGIDPGHGSRVRSGDLSTPSVVPSCLRVYDPRSGGEGAALDAEAEVARIESRSLGVAAV